MICVSKFVTPTGLAIAARCLCPDSAEVYNCASVFSFLAEKLNGMISSRINSPNPDTLRP